MGVETFDKGREQSPTWTLSEETQIISCLFNQGHIWMAARGKFYLIWILLWI